MLGFERKEPFVISGKYAQELMDMLERMRTGNYNQEDLERLHFQNVTPKYRMVMKGETFDPFCKYCEEYRKNKCKGRDLPEDNSDCPEFHNDYDAETCKFCIFAKEGRDSEHVLCKKKNEEFYIKNWCIDFEKK